MLSLRQVSKRYGRREALAGVSLEVAAGETVALLGPNGAGKTTLLAIVAGLTTPDEGEVRVAGCVLPREAQAAKALVGIVPQEPALYPRLSVEENLLFFAHLYGVPREHLEERLARLLQAVGLAERAGDRVGTLSGGMRQRVNLAAALMHEPRVLLLDEPTTGLDPESRHGIWDLVHRFKGKDRLVLVSTHNLDEARALCDRGVLLRDGRVESTLPDNAAFARLEPRYLPPGGRP